MEEECYTRYIPFDGFCCNVYKECLNGAKLFYREGRVISSCPEKGVQIVDFSTGDLLHHFPEIKLRDWDEKAAAGIAIYENVITLYQIL